jgi:hypothetical protein
MLIGIGTVVAIGGIAVAFDHYTMFPIARKGGEQRLTFRLDAPYGSVDLRAGAGPANVATVELLNEDADPHAPQWSYAVRNGNGMLRIGIGTDEGMIAGPPIAMWQARSGFSTAAAIMPEPDWGTENSGNNSSAAGNASNPSFFSFTMPSLTSGYAWHQRVRLISTDAGNRVISEARAGTRITLAKDLPIDFGADLGLGESSLDLTGLPIAAASIETGASKAHIHCNAPNPILLHRCMLRAGLGQCNFNGISNLNADQFIFHGGLGSYLLGFEGKLTHNLDAVVDMGVGICNLSIPATAARVQVFYDDGLLTSFSCSGLVERRDGYWTSVGFDRSTSSILTLRISSVAGKISVSYH